MFRGLFGVVYQDNFHALPGLAAVTRSAAGLFEGSVKRLSGAGHGYTGLSLNWSRICDAGNHRDRIPRARGGAEEMLERLVVLGDLAIILQP